MAPAAFTISNLVITPAEVDIGETVTITLQVVNTGDLEGTYEVTLKINNVVLETKEVTLAGGASKLVTFTTSRDTAGPYLADADGLYGTFRVKAPPPLTSFNVWVIVGIVVGVIILAAVIWVIISSRREFRNNV